MIPLIQNTGIEIQRAVNKHQFRSIIYLAMAVVNTLISIPLASMYGPVGAALGTAISLLFANGLVMNIYYQRAMGLDMLSFWKSIAALSRGFIAPIVFGVWMMRAVQFHGLLDFALWVVFYTAVYALSFWLFGMDRDEKQLVLRPFAYLKHKDV